MIYQKGKKKGILQNVEVIEEIQQLDTKDYMEELILYKEILNKDTCNNFKVIMWEQVPYVVPIATQTLIALPKDTEGIEINDIYDMNPGVRMQNIHIGVFPLNGYSIVYPKCSTCQKAKKWLDEHNIEYAERHIVNDNPTYDELKDWYSKSGLPLKKFFNTSGLLYKEMQLKDKLPTMSEEEQLQLLATNGMLVKRPLVVKGNIVLVGFKEAEWTEKLNGYIS